MENLRLDRTKEITASIQHVIFEASNLRYDEISNLGFGVDEQKVSYLLREFSLAEAEFFLNELKRQFLIFCKTNSCHISPGLLKELDFTIALHFNQEANDRLNRIAPGVKLPELTKPIEDFFEHEMRHVQKAYDLGMDLSKAVLGVEFRATHAGLWAGLFFYTYEDGEEMAIKNLLVGLAPIELSQGDIQCNIQILADHPKVFFKHTTQTLRIIREFCDKTGYTYVRLLKEIMKAKKNIPNALRKDRHSQ